MIVYLICVIPPMLLGLWAQSMVSLRYNSASKRPAPMTGAAAARQILDSAGLTNIPIEMIPGKLSDHYDPRAKVVRLSEEVYQNASLASVGIAAHECGHAIQDATHYPLLVVRNLAVPIASIGSNLGMWLILIGAILGFLGLVLIGVIFFAATVVFQIINLPVEYNASARAKEQLVQLNIIPGSDLIYVKKVLGAAAMTYVAATLAAVGQLIYYLMIFFGRRD
ncbi:MAG: zinc metallopeptidase [Planctomycetia bacterium]|nr:zinc metallopeptidase [Planctomycetia bacterium]